MAVHTMKARVSGFDGAKSYEPGDKITVDTDQAKRLFLADRGDLLDVKGRKVPARSAATALGLNADDIARAVPALRAALRKKKGA